MSKIQTPAYISPVLPSWLRRLFSSKRDIISHEAAGRYAAAFAAAYARATLWGLRPPSIDSLPVRYATPASISAIQWQLYRSIGHISEDIVATQRFGITAVVRAVLEAELRVPLAYTLGYVQQNGQQLCHTSIEGLEQMLRTGIAPGARVSLHAWLTLPSHEIIDVAFWATLPAQSSIDERETRALFMHPDQLPGRTYHPQWVGDGFVRRIGILKEYEGW